MNSVTRLTAEVNHHDFDMQIETCWANLTVATPQNALRLASKRFCFQQVVARKYQRGFRVDCISDRDL